MVIGPLGIGDGVQLLDTGLDPVDAVGQADGLAENLAGGGGAADAQGVDAAQLEGVHAQFLGQ